MAKKYGLALIPNGDPSPDVLPNITGLSISKKTNASDFSDYTQNEQAIRPVRLNACTPVDALAQELDQLRKVNERLSRKLAVLAKQASRTQQAQNSKDDESSSVCPTVLSDVASLYQEVEHYKSVSQELSAHNEELVRQHNSGMERRRAFCSVDASDANLALRIELSKLLDLNEELCKKNQKLQEMVYLQNGPQTYAVNEDPELSLLFSEIAQLRTTNREILAENLELSNDLQDLIHENEELLLDLQLMDEKNQNLTLELKRVSVERDKIAEKLWVIRESVHDREEQEEMIERARREERMKLANLQADKLFVEEKLKQVIEERDELQQRVEHLEKQNASLQSKMKISTSLTERTLESNQALLDSSGSGVQESGGIVVLDTIQEDYKPEEKREKSKKRPKVEPKTPIPNRCSARQNEKKQQIEIIPFSRVRYQNPNACHIELGSQPAGDISSSNRVDMGASRDRRKRRIEKSRSSLQAPSGRAPLNPPTKTFQNVMAAFQEFDERVSSAKTLSEFLSISPQKHRNIKAYEDLAVKDSSTNLQSLKETNGGIVRHYPSLRNLVETTEKKTKVALIA